MKIKILLFLGFWWLLGLYYTGDIFGPGPVEAGGFFGGPTSKTKYNSSSTVINKNADGTTSSTTYSSSSSTKSWYPTQPTGGYYYAPSSGAGPNVIDMGKPVADVIGAVGELGRNVICLFGVLCRSSGSIGAAIETAKQPEYYQPQPKPAEPLQVREEGLSN